jgi:hypothetical protein
MESSFMKNCDNSAITKIQAAIIVVITIATIAISAYFLLPTKTETAPFSLNVINRPAFFGDIVYSIPGQKCLFLVTVEENQTGTASKPVKLSATSPDCEVAVFPQSITAGQVAELSVMPTQVNIGKNVTITLQAERQGLKQIITITTEVIEWENTLEPEAASMRDKFTYWLSINYPELGITNDTAWNGTIVNPRILVVMHYIFLSEDWEMYITWHVMIPPYDWARIYLRHRYNQTAPTYAFETSSIQEQAQPQIIEVPDWV